ncbi:MAG: phosphotransferase [Chloroflexi bacterium]|nr:phosphotransferase [Chloroflexota bacterium]
MGEVEQIQERYHNRLLRITLDGSTYILKVFGDPRAAREVGAYDLLQGLGVPTLHTVARTNDALLLGDVDASTHLRLAREEDVEKSEVGVALAGWYRTLHRAGSRLQTNRIKPSLLWREIGELTTASVLEVASRVGGSDQSEWVTLADNIDGIKNAAIASGETLTHNDFHWTNLALTRNEKPIRAVVFDYHLLGLGLRYSDCRNVTGSLGPDAADAFWSAYGATDPREKILDDLTAPLYVLVEAFRRPKFPSWAEQSLKLAETGEIHNRFDRLMENL